MQTSVWAGSILSGILLFSTPAAAESVLRVFPLDGTTGEVGAEADQRTWDSTIAGFTFAQGYSRDDRAFVVMLKRQTGEVRIFELDDGDIGPQRSVYYLERTYSSANVLHEGSVPYLVLHDEDDGALRRYELGASGSLGSSSSMSGEIWEGRATFGAYRDGGQSYYFGHNPWSGRTVLYRADGTPISDNQWTRGFTDVDFQQINSRLIQLLYKHNDEPGNQGGRLLIREISATGASQGNIYHSYAMGDGWTTVEIFANAEPPVRGYYSLAHFAVFFYNASTGQYRVRPLTTSSLNADSASGLLPTNLGDISFVRDGGTTYLVAVDEEEAQMLSAAEIENMADSIRGSQVAQGPGYQFAIMQSGKVVHQHAAGLAVVSTNTSMTNDTPMSFGSISKTVISVSMSRLADWDEVELDGHITDYVDYSGQGFSADPSQVDDENKTITLRDMFYHSSGWSSPAGSGYCSAGDLDDDLNCMGRLYNGPEVGGCDPDPEIPNATICPHVYENHNYSVMRHAIEFVSNEHDTQDVDSFYEEMWMDRVGLERMSCLAPAGMAAYYGCSGGVANCLGAINSWSETIAGDTVGCAGGGWKGSSIEMLKFMRGIRYRQTVGEQMAREILRIARNGDNQRVGIGWNTMNWVGSDGARPLYKVGSVPNTYNSVLLHFMERNVTLVVMSNAGISTTNAARAAWNAK